MIHLPFLDAAQPDRFPPVERALDEPDGLLAAGGDLAPERLLAAYRRGIFPWYSDGQPILWWSPGLRTVFDTARPHIPRRLARWLRNCDWRISADTAFGDVMRACAAPREDALGTWITDEMRVAYENLHRLGHAHSIEIRDGERLVGGLYGVAVGRMFFGESMFSTADNASKIALLALCHTLHEWKFPLLDAQVASAHLFSLGAYETPRPAFCARIAELVDSPVQPGSWRDRFPMLEPARLAGGNPSV